MKLRLSILFLTLSLASACGDTTGDPTGSNRQGINRIPCNTTPDCSARGGMCIGGQCEADNECASDADCSRGEVCTADTNFGGLCGPPGSAPTPGPAWSCTTDADCPAGQSCAAGTCGPTTVTEDCTNGTDDDGDGDIDCADADCTRDPACTPPVEQCSNGTDDDGDGDVDCADSDCTADPACAPPPENCSNGTDDDGDGDVDCADADCAADPACAPPPENCTNNVDDDGDGDVDCVDLDCVRDPVCYSNGCNGSNCPCDVLLQNCSMPNHRCYPGGPNAADGQCYPTGGKSNGDACIEPPVDTPDSCQAGLLCLYESQNDPTGICRVICATSADCAAGESCYSVFPAPTDFGVCHPTPAEDCVNGTDDDGDGDIDCADADCANDPICAPPPPPEDCTNGIDDDGDGDVDCADTECVRHPACP